MKSKLILVGLAGVLVVSGAIAACAAEPEKDGDGSGGGDGSFCEPEGQSCTGGEEYAACAAAACATEYEGCLGADYQAGTFGGPCQTYMECASPCGCDTACTQACAIPQACMDCLVGLGPCVQGSGCAQPVCTPDGGAGGNGGGGSGGGGAECTRAQACCDSLEPGQQEQCQTQVDAMAGTESACAAVVTNYQSAGLCTGI